MAKDRSNKPGRSFSFLLTLHRTAGGCHFPELVHPGTDVRSQRCTAWLRRPTRISGRARWHGHTGTPAQRPAQSEQGYRFLHIVSSVLGRITLLHAVHRPPAINSASNGWWRGNHFSYTYARASYDRAWTILNADRSYGGCKMPSPSGKTLVTACGCFGRSGGGPRKN